MGSRFGEALSELGIIKDEDVGWGLANQLNVPFIRLTSDTIDTEAVKLVPEPLARRHSLVPFLKIDNELTVVIEDPLNRRAISEVEGVSGCKVNICIGLPQEISQKIDQVYGTVAAPSSDISELEFELFSAEEQKEISNDFSGERFIRTLLDHTIVLDASSVHFGPSKDRVVVQFREDSGIKNVGAISEGWSLVLNSKLLSMLEMVETRENFLEGFLSHERNGRRFVFYTSIVSTKVGGAVTLLNLTPKDFPERFDDLPIDADQREAVLQIVGGRSGVAMVVGPGKIEKLNFIYLLLKKKKAEQKKTFSIGSMPWFVDAGYIQLKVKVEDRQDMLEGMKVALTQNPDILYIDDLWDRQALRFALQSTMANTFIMSSLHFPDTLTGLEYINESIDNKTLLTQSLRGLIGVHIFRTLCPKCKEVDRDFARQARALKMSRSEIEKQTIYMAKGCPACNHRGYKENRILIEPLKIDQELGDFLKAGHEFSKVRSMIEGKGHRTIEQQAHELVLAGEICINDFKNVERR